MNCKKFLIPLLFLVANLHATTYFVRSGASGNGTSWANAWGNVTSISWSSLNAGDTVCIAGGSYGTITTAKSGASGNPITIKRASASDTTCGSSTAGWSSSYDAQVVLTGLTLSSNYVTVDGNGMQNGFTMNLPASMCSGGNNCSVLNFGASTTGVTLRYIESSGPCGGAGAVGATDCNGGNGDPRNLDMDVWSGSTWEPQNNFLGQYLNLHGSCANVYFSAGSATFENSRFADSVNNDNGCHENIIIGGESGINLTLSYNEMTNWNTEGILLCPTNPCPASTLTMYGNVFHDPSQNTAHYPRIFAIQNSSTVALQVYNNDFINIPYMCYSSEGGVLSSGSVAYNNLYFNDGSNGTPFGNCGWASPMTEDYGVSDIANGETHGQTGIKSSLFSNYSAATVAGYDLATNTNAGMNLNTIFTLDYAGNDYSTSAWSRGAYQYVSSGATAPNPPTSLTVSVQ
jgi:hypothetical protein